MIETVFYGPELSGLPRYGLSPEGIVRYFYTLYDGRNPRTVRGPVTLVQPLTSSEVLTLHAECNAMASHVDTAWIAPSMLEREAVLRGGLIRYTAPDWQSVTVPAGEKPWWL